MGTWGTGIFEDDMAYEFFDEIAVDPRQFFIDSFETALASDYLEKDEAYAVIISAVYLDNYMNGTLYPNDNEDEEELSNVNRFKDLYEGPVLDDLQCMAVAALTRLLDEGSELNELWQEVGEDYIAWRGQIINLIQRLSN